MQGMLFLRSLTGASSLVTLASLFFQKTGYTPDSSTTTMQPTTPHGADLQDQTTVETSCTRNAAF